MPDSIYGHYWRGKVNGTLDTSYKVEPYVSNMVNGYTRALDIALTDKVRYKSLGITSALSLIGYYNNVKADKEAALIPTLKGLEIDTGNVQLQGIKQYLEKKTPAKQQPGQKTSNGPNNKTPGTKPAATAPKSTSTGASTGSKR